MANRKTQEKLAEETKAKKAGTKHAAPKKPATKAAEPSKRDALAADRDRVLKMLTDAGLSVEKKTAWHKATGKDGKRAYVATSGHQVHFTFPIRSAGVEALSEAEAKKRHLGAVRSILNLDRQTAEVITEVVKLALKDMR